MYRDRYQLVFQRVQRHPLFADNGLTSIESLIALTVRSIETVSLSNDLTAS